MIVHGVFKRTSGCVGEAMGAAGYIRPQDLGRSRAGKGAGDGATGGAGVGAGDRGAPPRRARTSSIHQLPLNELNKG